MSAAVTVGGRRISHKVAWYLPPSASSATVAYKSPKVITDLYVGQLF